jgi:hypothetical protein
MEHLMTDDFVEVDDETLQSIKDIIVDLVLAGKAHEISYEQKNKFASGEFVRGLVRDMEGTTSADFFDGGFIWNDMVPIITDMIEFEAWEICEECDVFTEARVAEIVKQKECTKDEWRDFLVWWINAVSEDDSVPPGEARKFYQVIPIVATDGRKCVHLMISTSEGAFQFWDAMFMEFEDFFVNVDEAKLYLRKNGLITEEASDANCFSEFMDRSLARMSFSES